MIQSATKSFVLLCVQTSGCVLWKGAAVWDHGHMGVGHTELHGGCWRCGGASKVCVGNTDGRIRTSAIFSRKF